MTEETTAQLFGHVVGENFRRLREGRKMTQSEAALHLRAQGLRWARTQVAALEAGARESVDAPALLLLAYAVGVSPAELFAGDGMVQLGKGSSAPRAWVRDVLNGRDPQDPISLDGPAARAWMDLVPGEQVSFQADAELAQRLGVQPEDVYVTAERLWGRNLHQERDGQVDAMGDLTASQRRIQRGHVTRKLAKQIEAELAKSEQ